MKLFILTFLISAIFCQVLVIGTDSVPSDASLQRFHNFNKVFNDYLQQMNYSSNTTDIPPEVNINLNDINQCQVPPTPKGNTTQPRPFPTLRNWTSPQQNQTEQNLSNSTTGPWHHHHQPFPFPQNISQNSTNGSFPCGQGQGRHHRRDGHFGQGHRRGDHFGQGRGRGGRGGHGHNRRHDGHGNGHNWRHGGHGGRFRQDQNNQHQWKFRNQGRQDHDFEMFDVDFENWQKQSSPEFYEFHFEFEPESDTNAFANNIPEFKDFQEFDFENDEIMNQQFKEMEEFMNSMINDFNENQIDNEFKFNKEPYPHHKTFDNEEENLGKKQQKKLDKKIKKLKKKYQKCPECFDGSSLDELLSEERQNFIQDYEDSQYNTNSYHHKRHHQARVLVHAFIIVPIIIFFLICCCLCKRRKARRSCKPQTKKSKKNLRQQLRQNHNKIQQPETIDLTGNTSGNQYHTTQQTNTTQPKPQEIQMIPMNYPIAIAPQAPQVPLQNLAYSYPPMPMNRMRNQFYNSMNVYPDLQNFQV